MGKFVFVYEGKKWEKKQEARGKGLKCRIIKLKFCNGMVFGNSPIVNYSINF